MSPTVYMTSPLTFEIELLLRCICLGRTPGFRRADVDIAFRKSLITAF
jgi:hypothetical protein